MKIISALKQLAVLLPLLAAPAAAAQPQHPWAFFDLGKTLISHSPDYKDMKWIPGAREYIKDLKARGFHLGMLINWPGDEGNGNAEKLQLVKKFLYDGWNDPAPFDWDSFEVVLFPPKDEYRKPNPYLFKQAVKMAGYDGAVYQGEDAVEMAAAKKAGLPSHRVIFFPEHGERSAGFLSPDEIIALVSKRGPDSGAARLRCAPACADSDQTGD